MHSTEECASPICGDYTSLNQLHVLMTEHSIIKHLQDRAPGFNTLNSHLSDMSDGSDAHSFAT